MRLFLAALEKDPSGKTGTPYMSEQLRAQIQAGRPMDTVLGIQGQFQSFSYENAISRGGGQAATVQVTLKLASGSPAPRLFTLVPESGSWRIVDVVENAA
mgnify:CR=1 FL=1